MCPLCRGGKFVHPLKEGRPDYQSPLVPCRCVRSQLEADRRERMLRWCELPEASAGMTFEAFKQRRHVTMAYLQSRRLAQGDLKWLTLMGGGNRGKTHLAVAVCRDWLRQGKLARYAYVPLLLDELRRGFGATGPESYEARWDMFLRVPLLVLDDLGAENPTPWVQERLDTLIDSRLMAGLALMVTTNLNMDEIPERIRSRLERGGEIAAIEGPEYSCR